MASATQYGRNYVSKWVPASSLTLTTLIVLASAITSTTLGYDGSMMSGLNILPQYTDYFHLTTATTSLNTASMWIGGAISTPFASFISDRWGRKWGMCSAAIVALIGVILQTAAQNVGMFVVARIVVGFGTTMSKVATPTYVSEAAPMKWRAFALGLFYDFWYIGGLTAAGITYGTRNMQTTWSWRLPSLIQAVPSLLCLAILPFLPESPRWLVYQDRAEDALEVLAVINSGGDQDDQVVLTEMKEIKDTLAFEKENGSKRNWIEPFRGKNNRKRMALALSVAVIGSLSGNTIISYYIGTMLNQAGITDTTQQLQVNIVLSVWCLFTSLFGTVLSDNMGRRFIAIVSTSGMIIFIFLVGALTKLYGDGGNVSGSYGTVATIFLFQGAYSFGWTPLSVMYPPEVLTYSIRASGMAIYTTSIACMGVFTTFVFPFALAAISWKTYMIFGSWDILELLYVIVYWIETKGKGLEEVDAVIEGVMHSDAPELAAVRAGVAAPIKKVEIMEKSTGETGAV